MAGETEVQSVLQQAAHLAQGAVEQLASRADEGAAELVLAVPGLLSDEDRARRRSPFAENRLRSRLVQGAGRTSCGGGAELFQRRPLGNERSGGFERRVRHVRKVHTLRPGSISGPAGRSMLTGATSSIPRCCRPGDGSSTTPGSHVPSRGTAPAPA